MVLLGEDLGGREEGGLSTAVDDLEHRPQRHEGLAGADLALEQPVHRVVAGELVGDQVPDLALTGGELERQPRVEGRQDPVGSAGSGMRALLAVGGASPGQHQLEDQRLLEAEPLLRRAELAPLVGSVDPAERLHDVEQLELARGARG